MLQEYLLLKGVAAVSIHGGKSQEERNDAIKQFKELSKDVLVATDIAAKGLDFPDIQHVINYDMPKEIENYVHRIGTCRIHVCCFCTNTGRLSRDRKRRSLFFGCLLLFVVHRSIPARNFLS